MLISPEQVVNQFSTYLSPVQAELLGGMLLGVSPPRYSTLYTSMKSSGLIHLMVLSGSNITFLMAVVFLFFSQFGKRVGLLLTSIFIIFFTFFVGIEAPVLRATITALITIVYMLDGRKSNALYATVVSFLVILMWKTELALSLSSQLSYGATLGIVLFYKPIIYRGTSWTSRTLLIGLNELLVSLSAMILVIPVLFYNFDSVQFQGILATLLVSPVVGVVMVLGFLLALAAFASPLVAQAIAFVITPFLMWIIQVATFFAQ